MKVLITITAGILLAGCATSPYYFVPSTSLSQPGHMSAVLAKNRDALIAYLKDAEKQWPAGKNFDYALSVAIETYGCREEYKTYDDIPAHSVPCPGTPHWLIRYTEDR